jgi:phosphoribosylanthranilate isomerase
MTRIKFCGLTRREDVSTAAELGADAVGFVLWPQSPRAIDVLSAARLVATLPPSVSPVGVFVRPTRDEVRRAGEVAGIRVVQVHGTGDVGQLADGSWHVWVAAWLSGADAIQPDVPQSVTVLLDVQDPDRHGGTGTAIDWDAAGRIAAKRRVLLAGGLTPENVGEAIRRARPYGVDVSTGIEDRPGIKNAAAMKAFAAAVRATL